MKTHDLYELEARNRYLEYLLNNKNMSNLPQVQVNKRNQLIRKEVGNSFTPNVVKLDTSEMKATLSKGQSESSLSRKGIITKQSGLKPVISEFKSKTPTQLTKDKLNETKSKFNIFIFAIIKIVSF